MGAVLSQRQEDGCLHPVAFMSKGFTGVEVNYDMHDKKLLAIIRALDEWRIHQEGTIKPITIFTDHRNLEYWREARTFNQRQAQWHLFLAAYNFAIHYRPGKRSEKPDALLQRADHGNVEPTPQVMIDDSKLVGFLARISNKTWREEI